MNGIVKLTAGGDSIIFFKKFYTTSPFQILNVHRAAHGNHIGPIEVESVKSFIKNLINIF